MDILLSVIIPVYNVKEYVEKCIESICNQTYQNLEIILVDDGSTDGSGEICDNFAKRDKRIKVIHKKNGGAVSARKAGAEIAKGDYVVQVDGDDWIDKERFENLVNKGLDQRVDMVYMNGVYREYKNGNSFSNTEESLCGYYTKKELFDNYEKYLMRKEVFVDRVVNLALWSWCIKRELYVSNQMILDDKIARVQDIIVVLACLGDSKDIKYINEPNYHYVQEREGAISMRKNYPKESAKYYYMSMTKYIKKCNMRDKSSFIELMVKNCYNSICLTNYKELYDYYQNYLFPFSEVFNGKRIIVYGAGNFGAEIVNTIMSDSRFDLVAWVDKSPKVNPRNKYNVPISSKDILDTLEFDYIVISILNASIAKKVKQELGLTINKSKIVLMSSEDMKMEHLNKMFGYKYTF